MILGDEVRRPFASLSLLDLKPHFLLTYLYTYATILYK